MTARIYNYITCLLVIYQTLYIPTIIITTMIQNYKQTHKAVAPIIATLLMVAIAVVGGILIFVFAQGFFSDSSVQGPSIDSLTFIGYDTRDSGKVGEPACTAATSLMSHSGVCITGATGAISNNLKTADAMTLFVKNSGAKSFTIDTVKYLGNEYVFSTSVADVAATIPANGAFLLATTITAEGTSAGTGSSIIEPGEEKTIVLRYDGENGNVKVGRSGQVIITTGNGATFALNLVNGIVRGV